MNDSILNLGHSQHLDEPVRNNKTSSQMGVDMTKELPYAILIADGDSQDLSIWLIHSDL